MIRSVSRIKQYLEKYKDLPEGCRLYQMSFTGRMFVAAGGKVDEVSRDSEEYKRNLHTFINPGNLAYYLLGTPETNEHNPTNATAKVGVTEPHHHFIPHAHGVEHYVFSYGFSGCVLFDHQREMAQVLKMPPGSLIYISAMVPHMFYNRSDVPLITLIANGGLGINDDRYAVTQKMANDMLDRETDPAKQTELRELAYELGSMDKLFVEQKPENDMSLREKISQKLYTLAEYVSIP